MNKNPYDNLWLTAHNLHGTLGIPELCRLIIYLMLINYFDIKKSMDGGTLLPSYDDKFSVTYLEATYGKIVFPEHLIRYMKNMEKDLMLKDSIVSGELESLLKKTDTGHVHKIFKSIMEIGFQDIGQLYDAASFLLEKMSNLHGNLRNGTSSNRSLCKLEGLLLECRDGMSVYDGFCGHGFSANEAAGGKGIVYLQDTDKSAKTIACAMALLKGNRIGAARCGDSLADPMTAENGKFDRVVCEPPFVSRYDEVYRDSIPKDNYIYPDISDDASVALRHALAKLKEGGKALVLVPNGVIVNYKSSEVRKNLVETYLDAVIELPAGAIPNTGVASALLIMKKDTGRKSIYMLDAKSFFEKVEKNQLAISDENINRIYEMYKNREKSDGISIEFEKSKIEKSKSSLCASQYIVDPQNAIMIDDTAAYLKKYQQLAGELAEVDNRLEKLRARFLTSGKKEA